MPITLPAGLRDVEDREFAEEVYEVLGCVFAIHKEFGRFFEEGIYKRELALRLPAVQLEAPVQVAFDPFRTVYFLDALAGGCAIFEFKAVEALHERHRAQLIQYLLLCDLPHGKLVNMRPETVEHEFVNAPFRRPDRSQFEIATTDWIEFDRPGMRDWLTALLCDLGTGLGIGLYEEALTQYLSGREQVDRDVEVISAGQRLGYQRFRLIQPDVAFKITAFKNRPPEFEAHARRLLAHTPLRAIQWINVGRREVNFQTLQTKD